MCSHKASNFLTYKQFTNIAKKKTNFHHLKFGTNVTKDIIENFKMLTQIVNTIDAGQYEKHVQANRWKNLGVVTVTN